MNSEFDQNNYKRLGPSSVSPGVILVAARSLNDRKLREEDRFVVVVDPGVEPFDPIGVIKVQPEWNTKGKLVGFRLAADKAFLQYHPSKSFLSATRCPWDSDQLGRMLEPSPIYPLVEQLLKRSPRRLR